MSNGKQKIVEDIFENNGIKWKIKEFGSYIDPKCKTAESIYSKLIRLYPAANNKTEFTVLNSGINDLLRMTVIVEYNEVISTIKKLKHKFPDLTGYLKIKNSGYCGIHLNLKVDGLPCEIQLAPRVVVMVVDYLHTLHEKWRDFDPTKEIKLIKQKEQKIFNMSNIQEKTKLIRMLEEEKNNLQNKIEEEKIDFGLRRKTYNEVYDYTNFSFYQEDIAKILNELRKNKNQDISVMSPEFINIFNMNLLTDGEIDKDKVKQVTEQLSNSIEYAQKKFVDLVKDCLQL